MPRKKNAPPTGQQILQATLADGSKIDYVHSDNPPAGGMKETYFAPDRSSVVQFFKDGGTALDSNRIRRLEAIIGKYNPTVSDSEGGSAGTTREQAEYYRSLFCWPTAIVTAPRFGIVAPTYRNDFFFSTGPFKGKEKNGKWFSSQKLRKLLPQYELGPWLNYFVMSIKLARAVSRMHMAGLAHSDLSPNNVLLDPVGGGISVIDIDSLVVPGLFAPDVIGTPKFIAPEVLVTQSLPKGHPNKKLPSTSTDLHALATLLYQNFFRRHPIDGPKINSTASSEEDDFLSMGSKALFIEHPVDHSNRPVQLSPELNTLGPVLQDLFTRAFVDGLHDPGKRPSARQWESGLLKTWDMLMKCSNPLCENKWFVSGTRVREACSSCGAKQPGCVPVFQFQVERRLGHWMSDGELIIYDGIPILSWHVYSTVYPGIGADKTVMADCQFHAGRWLLINRALRSLRSPGGNPVPIGQAIELRDGVSFRLAEEPDGRRVEVRLLR